MFSLRTYKGVWQWAAVVAVLHTCYAAKFISSSGFVVEGRPYFCLLDDAMISMQYASNWARGHGLVWYPGDRVEGYTNPAWTLVMGLCHLPGFSPSHTCLVVQLLGIPILWGCLVALVRLARACRLTPVAACCAIFLGMTQWNLNYFTLMGMESGLLTMLVTFGLAETVTGLRRREGRIRPMLWFAAALLVRPDAVIVLALAAGLLLMPGTRHHWRTLVGLGVVFAVTTGHVLWRHHFYGSWLPNTYYLKATGWALSDRLPVGFRTGIWTVLQLLVPLGLALISLSAPRRWHLLLGGAFGLSLAYQIYVGGDAWQEHYRFVLPTSLGLMVLAADGIYIVSRYFTRPGFGVAARVALTALGVITVNYLPLDYWSLRLPPLGREANRISIQLVWAVDRIADPQATAAVTWAGAFPYFSGRRCFDILGKNDAYIARTPAHPFVRQAGHNKFDLAYTVSHYHPDMVIDGLRLMDTEFHRRFRFVEVPVDDTTAALCVRKSSLRVHGGTEIPWDVVRERMQMLSPP